ncbi:MAG TPA: hypothetical protein VGV40_02130 [Solirubrobacteraceae bacterium]|nr:hypothetical protein [Solirubrobacteraceae bacterium]
MKARAMTAATLASVLLAACGGGSGNEGGGADAADGASRSAKAQDAMLKFAQCMRREGVEMADPGGNGLVTVGPGSGDGDEPPNSARFRRAEQTCERYLREAGPPPQLSEEDPEEFERKALAFTRCMREQGVDLPDPEMSRNDGGTSQQLPEGADPQSPRFREAEKACRHVAPGSSGPAQANP